MIPTRGTSLEMANGEVVARDRRQINCEETDGLERLCGRTDDDLAFVNFTFSGKIHKDS